MVFNVVFVVPLVIGCAAVYRAGLVLRPAKRKSVETRRKATVSYPPRTSLALGSARRSVGFGVAKETAVKSRHRPLALAVFCAVCEALDGVVAVKF